jgi:hypothetical protein
MTGFADQVYIDRIREALWRPVSGAAVMVGSGLSRNAKPRSPGSGQEFPGWAELTLRILDHLYPPARTDPSQRLRAVHEAGATSGMLRIAEEYRVAFGRTALDRLIAELVPDLQFEPSELHERLLDLPWADVFTTNWDTLLERTVLRLSDRHYDIVTSAAELPRAARPRIVKLHGTLPAQGKLIITEEDFRCYPREFAPFVNLAQQSMMENVFCLIGFSGDDPNFLHWSGWVRDHLGDAAPQIYLVGWLGLSAPRRRMLEDRRVVTIDLAGLPLESDWPAKLRGHHAIEWLLFNLRQGEPYRALDWPKPRKDLAPVPPYLRPLPGPPGPAPEGERTLTPLSIDSPPTLRLAQLVEVSGRWRFNRRLYPGWVVAPRETREILWWSTKDWIMPVIEALRAAAGEAELLVASELVWRMETSLVPLFTDMIEPLNQLLRSIDPRTIKQEEGATTEQGSGDLADPQEAWIHLGLALLRSAREDGNIENFGHWAEALSAYFHERTGLDSRIRYERCLLALYRLDHRAVEAEVISWRVDDDEPFSAVRKASILAEILQTARADELARQALRDIKRRRRKDRLDIASLSREGWAMMLCNAFRYRMYMRSASMPTEDLDPQRGWAEDEDQRWRTLAAFRCDPWQEVEALRNKLAGAPPIAGPSRTEEIGFGPGEGTVTHHLHFGGFEPDLLPAYQMQRLYEDGAVPPVADWTMMSKDGLLRAAEWLQETDPQRSIAILLRACTSRGDAGFSSFFTSERVALLTADQVDLLYRIVETSLDYSVPRATAATPDNQQQRLSWLGRAGVGTELLARLAPRLSVALLEQCLTRAAEYYKTPAFRQRIELTRALAGLFERSLKALGERISPRSLLDLVSLPVPGIGQFEPTDRESWPEPIRFIKWPAGRDGGAIRQDTAPAWDRALMLLIEAVRGDQGPYARKCGLLRLWNLHQWGILSEEEQTSLAQALWNYPLKDGSGLPQDIGLRNSALLKLPEPEPGRAAIAFRQSYMAIAGTHFKLPLSSNYLIDIWNALGALDDKQPALVLTSEEARLIVQKILVWSKYPVGAQTTTPFPEMYAEELRELCTNLCMVLGWQILLARTSFELTEESIEEIVAMIEALHRHDLPTDLIYPALVRVRKDLLPELTARLRHGVASLDPVKARTAAIAVFWWMRRMVRGELDPPPADLPRELALVISVRRESNLLVALEVAEWIFDHLRELGEQDFARPASEGLGYLLEEARYGFHDPAALGPQRPRDVQLLRIRCGRLARSMANAGHHAEPAIASWLRAIEEDPMAEVRQAVAREER